METHYTPESEAGLQKKEQRLSFRPLITGHPNIASHRNPPPHTAPALQTWVSGGAFQNLAIYCQDAEAPETCESS